MIYAALLFIGVFYVSTFLTLLRYSSIDTAILLH